MSEASIIAFSGKIGSGKSSISTVVAEFFKFERISFGDYVRALVAAKGGDPASRKELQDEGQRRVIEDPVLFLSGTLEFHHWSSDTDAIVDGLRHISILSAMRDRFGARMFHIHLNVENSKATERALRRGDEHGGVKGALQHVVEADVDTNLLRLADLAVDADQPQEKLVSDCISAVRTHFRK